MIKKFDQFVSENWFVESNVDKSKFGKIQNIISEEELEDQFLRLKEVLGCEVKNYVNGSSQQIKVLVTPPHEWVKEFVWWCGTKFYPGFYGH